MKPNLLEPTPERRQEAAANGVTPRTLLRRWGFLVYAVAKLLVGALVVGMTWLFVMEAVDQLGVLSGDAIAIIFILGFIPISQCCYDADIPLELLRVYNPTNPDAGQWFGLTAP